MGPGYPNETFLQLVNDLIFSVNLSKYYLDIIFWNFKPENIQLVGEEIWRLAETVNSLKYFVKTKNYFADVKWMGSETTSLLKDLTTLQSRYRSLAQTDIRSVHFSWKEFEECRAKARGLMQRTKKLLVSVDFVNWNAQVKQTNLVDHQVQQRATLLEDRAKPNRNIARWNNFELIPPDLETERTPLYWQYSAKISLSNISETSMPTWALDEPIYRCLARADDLKRSYYDIEHPEDGLYDFYSIYQRPDDYLEHGQMHSELFCH